MAYGLKSIQLWPLKVSFATMGHIDKNRGLQTNKQETKSEQNLRFKQYTLYVLVHAPYYMSHDKYIEHMYLCIIFPGRREAFCCMLIPI